jgi:hypothetical protein
MTEDDEYGLALSEIERNRSETGFSLIGGRLETGLAIAGTVWHIGDC